MARADAGSHHPGGRARAPGFPCSELERHSLVNGRPNLRWASAFLAPCRSAAEGRQLRSKMELLDGNRNNRILVVDDNEGIHGDFDKVLDNPDRATGSAQLDALAASLFGEKKLQRPDTNFQVTHARQGEEAFELVLKSLRERTPYALAFVDVRMPPGWDGMQTIERIWSHDTEIEIVLCTAHADYSWEQIAERLPHAERLLILRKPFDPLEVRQLAYGLTAKWFLRRQATSRALDLKRMVVQRMRDIELIRSRIAEVAKQQAAPASSRR